MDYGFGRTPEYSFGIEEEFQLYDRTTLKPVNARDVIASNNNFKPEILLNMVEINTEVCHDISEAEEDLRYKRGLLKDICIDRNIYCVGIGIFPYLADGDVSLNKEFAVKNSPLFLDKKITDSKNFVMCGTHIHLSVSNMRRALKSLHLFNFVSPYLCALSANSPYFKGKDTGFENYRRQTWLKTGKLLLDLKSSEMPWLINKYNLDEYFSPENLTESIYSDLISTNFIMVGSWPVYIDSRTEKGTVHLRQFDQTSDIKRVLGYASLSRGLGWCILNNCFPEQGYKLDRKDLVSMDTFCSKKGLKSKHNSRRCLELIKLVSERCDIVSDDELKIFKDDIMLTDKQRQLFNKPKKLTEFFSISA